MRKLLSISLTVLVMALLVVSCSPESKALGEDGLALISFSPESGITRSLTRTNPTLDENDFYWYYTAVKADDTGLVVGEKTTETPANVENSSGKGLGTNEVGPFSYGKWTFKLFGYNKENKQELAYEGSAVITITKSEGNSLPIVVAPKQDNSGYLEFPLKGSVPLTYKNEELKDVKWDNLVEKITFNKVVNGQLASGTGNVITEYDYATKTTDEKMRTKTLASGSWAVTFSYQNEEDSAATDEKPLIVYAKETIYVAIADYLTTTIGGTIASNTGTVDIGVTAGVVVADPVTTTIATGSATTVTVNAVPASAEKTGEGEAETTIEIPQGAISGTNVTTKVTTYTREAAAAATPTFTIEDTSANSEAANMGGIDVAMYVDNATEPTKTFENSKELTFTTTIAKNLNKDTLVAKYNGEGTDGTITAYNASTGVVTFTVGHLSTYYFVSKDAVFYNKDTQYAYKTLKDAVEGITATEGQIEVPAVKNRETIVLLKDYTLTETDNLSLSDKSFTLDLDGFVLTPGSYKLKVNSGALTVKGSKSGQDGQTAFVDGCNKETGIDGTYYATVATIGNNAYSTLADAVAALTEDNQTITLQRDAVIGSAIEVKYSTELALNGKLVTVSGGALTIADGKTLKVSGTAATDQKDFVSGVEVNDTAKAVAGVYYPTLAAAITAASDNSVVTLLKDMSIGSDGITCNNSITLDLNGHEISGEGKITVAADKVLTVKDGEETVDAAFMSGVQVGTGKYYPTFEAAVTAATANDTIKLMSDVTVNSAVTLRNGITLDLNQKTLTFADGKNLVIQPYTEDDNTDNKSTITVLIKDGSINGGSGDCSVIKVNSYVDLTLDAVTMTASKVGNWNALVFLAVGADPAKLTIQNKCDLTMNGAYGVGTNATTNANVEVIINDSKITAKGNNGDSCGLVVNVSAKVTLEKAIISGERQGVFLRSIGKKSSGTWDAGYKATIKDSTISSTGTGTYNKYEGDSQWDSGTDAPAAAVVIGSKNGNYHRTVDVEFKGTNTLSHASDSAFDIYVYQESEDYPVKVTGDIEPGWTNNADMNGASYPVAKVGSDYKTGDLQTVINNAADGSTIELMKDIKLTSGSGVSIDKDLTLNGNGHTIYAETWSGTTPLIQIGSNGTAASSRKIALENLDVEITGNVTSSKSSRVRLMNICNIGKSDDSSYDGDSSVTLTNVDMEIAATDTNKKNGTYLYGIFMDDVHGNIVLEKSSVKVPHYYAVWIDAGCDNARMTINNSRLEGWATIYNHSSNFTLESDSSEYVSNNPTSGGGYSNSFSSIIVAEYYNLTAEIGESKNNNMTFNGCTFTVTKTYDSANVKQVIANVRSPMGNKVYFNKCTLNPVENKKFIKVCADHVEGGASKIADENKGTSRVYIDGVDVTANADTSSWYVYNKNTNGESYYTPTN